MNKENLKILANWLEVNMKRIKAKGNFNMSKFECGTIRCAGGWAAKIPEFKGKFKGNYADFIDNVFGVYYDTFEFDFLFSACWRSCDNTIEGAIARIRYLVDGNELPDAKNFYNPENYKAYLPC